MNYSKALSMKNGDQVTVKRTGQVVTIEDIERVDNSDYRGVYFRCSDGNEYYHTTVQPALPKADSDG